MKNDQVEQNQEILELDDATIENEFGAATSGGSLSSAVRRLQGRMGALSGQQRRTRR